MCSAGTWVATLTDPLASSPPSRKLRLAWIKADVGFQGNEVADGLAKWASHSLVAAPLRPFRHILEHSGTTTVGRAPRVALTSLVRIHEHADLAVAASFDWFRNMSWFGVLPFK